MSANFVLLEKITVGAAGASSVTFSGIPQTGYTDLVLKISPRQVAGGVWQGISLTVNGSTSTYSSKILEGGDSTATSANGGATGIGMNSVGVLYASTFASNEVYIPNYTSSNYKSFSIDSVSEGNQSGGVYQDLIAGLWSTTSAITSITLTGQSNNFAQYSTFYLYGVAKLGTTPAIVPYATGGDTIMTDGTYWYHAFLSSGTFTPAKGLSCDVLVVAGGGSGGWPYSGGGGAGGVAYSTANSLTTTGYTVTIGAGAAGAYNTSNGVQGGNSQFGALTAAVGGGGGVGNNVASPPKNGGSGGGGAAYDFVSTNTANRTGGTGTSGQGNNGGNGGPSNWVNHCGGGGGGAGGVGGTATTTKAGDGGAGTNAYSSWLSVVGLGVSGFIAGGGGGGTNDTAANAGAAGSGGGGRGASNDGTQESGAGVANTGGGSGGGGAGNAPASPKNGGSGLVIVRYPI